MGVEPYLLPSCLVAIVAQRLVRRLCPVCRQPIEDPRRLLEELKVTPPTDTPLSLWKAVGCPECHGSGYRGRQAIFEIMSIDERFHAPIIRRAAHSDFTQLAREAGMRTMFDDGLRRAIDGVTTVEELLRVTRGH
jgi:type II secretory ATPase GspE/PulE/Tfp pilus assembly ATPase PilB-like protein